MSDDKNKGKEVVCLSGGLGKPIQLTRYELQAIGAGTFCGAELEASIDEMAAVLQQLDIDWSGPTCIPYFGTANPNMFDHESAIELLNKTYRAAKRDPLFVLDSYPEDLSEPNTNADTAHLADRTNNSRPCVADNMFHVEPSVKHSPRLMTNRHQCVLPYDGPILDLNREVDDED